MFQAAVGLTEGRAGQPPSLRILDCDPLSGSRARPAGRVSCAGCGASQHHTGAGSQLAASSSPERRVPLVRNVIDRQVFSPGVLEGAWCDSALRGVPSPARAALSLTGVGCRKS